MRVIVVIASSTRGFTTPRDGTPTGINPCPGTQDQDEKASHRTRELARRLYQLQSFPWFDRLLAKVRRDRLSGASFELDVVWVLQILAQRVRARETQNRLGSDFDVSIQG